MIPNVCKRFLKFWVPSGLLEAYRLSRGQSFRRRLKWSEGYPQLAKARVEEMFPGVESLEVKIPFVAVSGGDECVLPTRELAVLAGICMCRKPQHVFEIGTYQGSSTTAIALNTPESTEVYTLDLDPSTRDTHKHGLGVGGILPFEVGAQYRVSSVKSKIHQLYGNSLTYNYQPYLGKMDMVLVDADHTYEFVRRDTETAFQLLAPGGIVLWDDYVWNERHPECAGVTRCLNELGRKRKVYQIDGTRLAIYCDGGGETRCRG